MLSTVAHTLLDSCGPDPKFSKQDRGWKPFPVITCMIVIRSDFWFVLIFFWLKYTVHENAFYNFVDK